MCSATKPKSRPHLHRIEGGRKVETFVVVFLFCLALCLATGFEVDPRPIVAHVGRSTVAVTAIERHGATTHENTHLCTNEEKKKQKEQCCSVAHWAYQKLEFEARGFESERDLTQSGCVDFEGRFGVRSQK